jgi:hypothetical protein
LLNKRVSLYFLRNIFICVAAVSALNACINVPEQSDENVLARVYDDYLYESDLKGIVPEGTNVKDSIAIVRNFVNGWITEMLELNKAHRNLLEEDMQFEKQLEEYRKSLIIYQYESKLISQTLDTVVDDSEIEDYYKENIGNFQLKNNIVKVYYARFNVDNPKMATIRKFFYSEKPDARDSLDVYIEKYSNLYFLDDETWILFDDLLKFVPIETYNEEAYLQNHRKIELKVEPHIYLVGIKDFKIKESVSPLSFEKEKIRQIIINKRKLEIINRMREEIFRTAQQHNDFEIY